MFETRSELFLYIYNFCQENLLVLYFNSDILHTKLKNRKTIAYLKNKVVYGDISRRNGWGIGKPSNQ